ncbi:MAG: hypothetical protein OEY38_22460, partial [Gammaproteobacteria bacterium]|nr:hypothetical protein [Gammaproteobacteria bacterium]
FSKSIDLNLGKNVIGLESTLNNGKKRLVNYFIDISDRDANQQAIIAKPPIPKLSVSLPSSNYAINSQVLHVNGTTQPGNQLVINKQTVSITQTGNFQQEVQLPIGKSTIEIEVSDAKGHIGKVSHPVEVAQNQVFMLAFADAKFTRLTTQKLISANHNANYYSEGRVALYFKGYVRGEYLVTAALDTGRDDLGTLFHGLNKQDTQSFTRNLQAEQYYPVYGDSSQTMNETESQSKLYLAVKSDDLAFVLGNYRVNFSNNELSRYQRHYYGMRVHYQQSIPTPFGDAASSIVSFVAQNPTEQISNVLAATGGSLYYLSHRDIVRDSEVITLLVKDEDTGLVITEKSVHKDEDYEINYSAGRIIFHSPINRISDTESIVHENIQAGHAVFIKAHYDIETDAMSANAAGIKLETNLNQKIHVSVNHVTDNSNADNYQISSAKMAVKLNQNSKVSIEAARSDGQSKRILESDNGGIGFTNNNTDDKQSGQAIKLSSEIDVGEWLDQPNRYFVSSYFKHSDAGFQNSHSNNDRGEQHYGIKAEAKIDSQNTIRSGVTVDRTNNREQSQKQTAAVQWLTHYKSVQISSEVKSTRQLSANNIIISSSGVAAAQAKLNLTQKIQVVIDHQQTIQGEANSRSNAQANYQVLPNLHLNTRLASGSRGNAAEAGGNLQLGKNTIYISQRLTDDHVTVTNATVLGSETGLFNNNRLYTEYQWRKVNTQTEQSRLIGNEQQWRPIDGLTLNAYAEYALLNHSSENKRHTLGNNIKFENKLFSASNRNEVRRQSGDFNSIQYTTVNHFKLNLSPDYHLLSHVRFSRTEALYSRQVLTQFNEQSIGLAYRPTMTNLFNALGRYTRLQDYQSANSVGNTSSRNYSDIFAIEGSYKVMKNLEWIEKFAWKNKNVVTNSGLQTSLVSLDIHHLNYRFYQRFGLAMEYRRLKTSLAQNQQQGWLSELTWQANTHLQLGFGFNFTHFTDNLVYEATQSQRGWFIRLQGSM